jgi:hypothetical protein
VHARRPQTTIVLDMDSSVSETRGAQEGSAYNGHFACIKYTIRLPANAVLLQLPGRVME